MRVLTAAGILLVLGACVHHMPNEERVQRPIHKIKTKPDQMEQFVSPPLWHHEMDAYVTRMRHKGWAVADVLPAAEEGTFLDDPIKHQVILVFERYVGEGE